MDITNNDIADIVKIIDVCSSRGAFRGEELAGIGTLRNKLVSYLQSIAQPAPEQTEDDVIN